MLGEKGLNKTEAPDVGYDGCRGGTLTRVPAILHSAGARDRVAPVDRTNPACPRYRWVPERSVPGYQGDAGFFTVRYCDGRPYGDGSVNDGP